jgi:lysophospholipase L1-like esterase
MAQGNFLFIGDYLIANYDWQKRMPFFEVYSYGFPLNKAEELLKELPKIEKKSSNPDIILIAAGINNVIVKDYTFVDQIRRMVIRLSNIFPEAEIIINSLPNIRIPFVVEDAIFHLNNNIKLMASQTGCCYLDNFAKLAQKETDLFTDGGIDLTNKTYDIWSRSILEFVAFLFEDD